MADPLDDLDKKLENLTINELPQHFEGPDYIRALERKVQLIEEKSKKVEQKAAEEVQKVKDEGFHGKILTEGFPPLDSGPLHSTQSQAQKKTVQFELSTEEINLPMFDSYILKKRNSLLWQIPRDWRGETAIKRLVALAVQDCINSTPGCENLKVLEEVIFVNADTGTKDRVDLAITRSPQTSVVVGAIEVKKPPTETQEKNGKEFDMNNAGPLIQYMYDLRSNHGVRFVFGILTTYVKWRFFWLEDSSEAMLCEDLDEYKEMCSDSPLISPIEGEASKPVRDAKIMNKANVEMSRVYNYNDKELVPVLCMLLRKWQLVPCDRVNGFLHENRLYQVVKNEQKACGFSTLPAKLKQFSYEFPPSGNTSIYYILHTYKRSGDGKVALCTASAEKETVGLIGVVKFFINDSGKKAEELMALHEQELWKILWNTDVKITDLFGSSAIMMLFVFHIRSYPSELRFCPMSAWNFRAPLSKDEKAVIFDVETIREDSELQKHESASLLGNPLKVAEIVLHRMIIECGWKQDDDEVKWDHIGLLPTFVNGEWLLKPVMIDLARVTEIKDESREEVYKHHLGILKKSMPSEQTEE